MAGIARDVHEFVEHCVALTGFSEFDLHATGMGGLYLKTAREQVGHARFEKFLAVLAYKTASAQKKESPLKPDDLGATDREIGRAVVYLWYTGAWPRLAQTVHTELWESADHDEQQGKAHARTPAKQANAEFVVSPSSYVEGLVWHTFNGHPVGARPPGFGTWSVPPAEQPSVEQIEQECGIAAKPKDGPTGEASGEEVSAADPEATTLARLRRPGPRFARHVPPSAVSEAREPQQEVDPA